MALGVLGIPLLRKRLQFAKLKREHGSSTFTSARTKAYMGPFESPMTVREATLILGVRESAGKDKILAAHRRLMLLNHPDNGGSTYIATKVNQAKETIIDRLA